MQEMLTSANMAFSLCPLLTQGAIDALLHYGDERQRAHVPAEDGDRRVDRHHEPDRAAGRLRRGRAHARVPSGRTTARYRITGQKIFITYGEHDLTDQIVHLVLARTPDAPAGTEGISCFIVPKFLVDADGSLGDRNGVQCVSIEHKLGIHGSPTCVLSYEDATGHLIGDENMPACGSCS